MIRLGIVDFDSSHCVEFTKRINQVGVSSDQWVDGARVVAGWPGTSEMAPERITTFTPQMEACGVALVDDPAELLDQIDAVLILSLSGLPHLERARPFLEAGLPTYVDKPMACSVDDARTLFDLAATHGVSLFSTSAIRYCGELVEFSQRNNHGQVQGAVSYGPAWRAEGNPGLFHYGIHPVEVLYSLMGPGCHRVATEYSDSAEIVTARWQDDRLAVIRGGRTGATAYGFVAYCDKAVIHRDISTRFAYRNLCTQIVNTFAGHPPPIPPEVTLEVMGFIESALLSEQRGGEPVEIPGVSL